MTAAPHPPTPETEKKNPTEAKPTRVLQPMAEPSAETETVTVTETETVTEMGTEMETETETVTVTGMPTVA